MLSLYVCLPFQAAADLNDQLPVLGLQQYVLSTWPSTSLYLKTWGRSPRPPLGVVGCNVIRSQFLEVETHDGKEKKKKKKIKIYFL